uniref:Transmembrane protein n=1 Tax=Tanacetum cinerariifolium TaxID=118510 RepID=A0A699GQP3_TANCI|nr:hypothetical protein [Tanacetum cinerariifolium]
MAAVDGVGWRWCKTLMVAMVVGGGIGVWVGLVVATMVGGDGGLVVCDGGGLWRWWVGLVVEAVRCSDGGGHVWW